MQERNAGALLDEGAALRLGVWEAVCDVNGALRIVFLLLRDLDKPVRDILEEVCSVVRRKRGEIDRAEPVQDGLDSARIRWPATGFTVESEIMSIESNEQKESLIDAVVDPASSG